LREGLYVLVEKVVRVCVMIEWLKKLKLDNELNGGGSGHTYTFLIAVLDVTPYTVRV
jgi:hypothetical protein